MHRAAFVFLTGVILTACSRAVLGSEANGDERERAAAAAARIERDWPLAGTGPISGCIHRVANILADAAGAVPFRWRFTVVRDRSANAFAIGDGRVYVNEGAFLFSENEAELAAILAHEMGHQLAGHFRNGRLSESKGLFSDLVTIFGNGHAEPDRGVGGVRRELDLPKELEADRISLHILTAAGYDPHAALTIAVRLRDQSDLGSRHLRDEHRILALRSLLEDVPSGGRLDSEEFEQVKREVD